MSVSTDPPIVVGFCNDGSRVMVELDRAGWIEHRYLVTFVETDGTRSSAWQYPTLARAITTMKRWIQLRDTGLA